MASGDKLFLRIHRTIKNIILYYSLLSYQNLLLRLYNKLIINIYNIIIL